jgi:hypothetical protein
MGDLGTFFAARRMWLGFALARSALFFVSVLETSCRIRRLYPTKVWVRSPTGRTRLLLRT